ncbi:MAG: hypothetical protein J0H18_15125 [Rhizobiales bacterium]|nr:hypothetical protein [Hyphomicrobiales bacterium]
MSKFIMLAAAAAISLAASVVVHVQAKEPVKVAFVCTGNTGRSVTAEALAKRDIAEKKLPITVISRGVDVDPFDTLPEANAVAVLSAKGIDVSAHRSVQLDENDVRHADLILTATAKHKAKVIEQFPDAKDKTFTLAEYATGKSEDVLDAWGKPMEAYEAMEKQVEGYLPAALAKAAALHKE